MNEIIVALDVDTPAEAHALADTLRGAVGGFKVGSQLFTSQGPSVVADLVANGDRVFLDLKFHDIPNTVAGAAAAASRLGVWMLNVHASGGAGMMRAAADAARAEARKVGRNPPLVIAVTVLTSMDAAALAELGVQSPVASHVEHLASLAQHAGLDGVVASPQELPLVRARCGSSFLIVTPGIRGAADAKGDQQRTMAAEEALAAGANYLVVGRPITRAPDPRAAAEEIARACQARLLR
jgi:orotidine-5'-phosphate decarboxylase